MSQASKLLEQLNHEIDLKHSAIRNHASLTNDLVTQLESCQKSANALRQIIAKEGDREISSEELNALLTA